MKTNLFPLRTLFMLIIVTFNLPPTVNPGRASEFKEPTDAASIMTFADTLFHHGHYYRALMEYERFSYFYPQHPAISKARFNIACSMKKAGDYNASLALFSSLAKVYKGTPFGIEASFQKAEVYQLMHDYQSALNQYTKFLSHYSQHLLAEKARSAMEEMEKQLPRRSQRKQR